MHFCAPSWVVSLLAALLVAGCGESKPGDQDKVEATFARLVAAIDKHDGPAACALFTPQGRLAFERYQNQGSGEPPLRCDALMKDLTVPGTKLVDLKVRAKRATAGLLDEAGERIKGPAPVAFAKVNGRWLVDKFGPFGP